MNAKSVLFGIGAAVVLSLSCFAAYRFGLSKGRSEAINVTVDTLTVRDTIVRDMPLFYESITVDTVLIAGDTIRVRDTLYMEVPREQKAYRDDLYSAWVSGVGVQLDSIHVYQATRYVTKQVKVTTKQRVTFGAQLGFGAQYGLAGRTFDCGPYLGIGVSVNF